MTYKSLILSVFPCRTLFLVKYHDRENVSKDMSGWQGFNIVNYLLINMAACQYEAA